MMNRMSFMLACGGALGRGAFRAASWHELIIGESLAGWRATGSARWLVEGGELIGRQGPNGEAGDLFSERHWKDFELECEWRMRFPGNSGIWFRVGGPRTGYQADFLDQPSHPGVLSGSLYCMGKAFIAENRDAQSVHRDGWNQLRIRAVGERIRIEQNGRKVVEISDGTFADAGSVGIQVHAGKQFDGMEVRVRKFRISEL